MNLVVKGTYYFLLLLLGFNFFIFGIFVSSVNLLILLLVKPFSVWLYRKFTYYATYINWGRKFSYLNSRFECLLLVDKFYLCFSSCICSGMVLGLNLYNLHWWWNMGKVWERTRCVDPKSLVWCWLGLCTVHGRNRSDTWSKCNHSYILPILQLKLFGLEFKSIRQKCIKMGTDCWMDCTILWKHLCWTELG